MKHCPTCRTGASDEALYCRSCYSVFPAAGQAPVAQQRQAARLALSVIGAVLFLCTATGIWIYQADPLNFSGTRPAAQSSATGSPPAATGPASPAVLFEGSATTKPAASNDSGPGLAASDFKAPRSGALTDDGNRWGRSVNSISAAAVEHNGGGCAISQAVHNGGSKIIFPVILEFSFQDAIGKRIGAGTRSSVEAILPAGERRGFTFQLPCPRIFASVNVATPEPDAAVAGNGSFQSVADLMAGAPKIDLRQLHLAIKVPQDLTICQGQEPCRLVLRFNDSWTAAWFKRDPRNPDMLVTSDSQLIGSLQHGWDAKVQLPLRNGSDKLTVTDAALRAPEAPSRWDTMIGSIKSLFGMGETSS